MSLSRPAAANPQPAKIARWLLIAAAMVFLMVVVGGITRLTESGLSMVRWEPISGTIPPLNEAQWHAEFDAYKATPEYQKINRGMSLDEFKSIFFWEYLHRLIGRLIGMVFAVPLLWFAWKRAIPTGYGPRLTALLALGGLQGAIGWWMVKSGLIDRPDVSHLRLAVHLLTALFILGGLVWTVLDLLDLKRNPATARPARLTSFSLAAMLVLFIQLLLGAFTAGLDAGYAFAEWPLMGGHVFPQGVQFLEPAWRNVVDNPIVVQFVHRWFAWVAAAMLLILGWKAQQAGTKGPAHAIATFLALQIVLGIATLLTGVDIHVAVAHQAVGALLVISVAWAAHGIGTRRG
ncbi:COX15/CtaA family protein [Sphingomonas sp. KC8]|uniref:COX15/CtaA family protein n=1 Tax=Sphingomonas sp. KC8 TaxID=1030157 RepID=UPI000248A7F8|nr:COX15/CtaA family protein [Sphingomonas sp. KC8]ARS27017.1 Heme A synthase [Sphingomonas sp. KC8]